MATLSSLLRVPISYVRFVIVSSHALNAYAFVGVLALASVGVYVSCALALLLAARGLSLMQRARVTKLNALLMAGSAGNLVTYHLLVDSYAETLPWEVVLHAALYALAYYYFYCYSTTTAASSQRDSGGGSGRSIGDSSQALIFDFKHIGAYLERKTSANDTNARTLNYAKFALSLFVASAYSAQLTFTTVCTPVMLFDWLLVVRDCSLIYSTPFSSLCSACGFFCLATGVVAFVLLIKIISPGSKLNAP